MYIVVHVWIESRVAEKRSKTIDDCRKRCDTLVWRDDRRIAASGSLPQPVADVQSKSKYAFSYSARLVRNEPFAPFHYPFRQPTNVDRWNGSSASFVDLERWYTWGTTMQRHQDRSCHARYAYSSIGPNVYDNPMRWRASTEYSRLTCEQSWWMNRCHPVDKCVDVDPTVIARLFHHHLQK